jgi:hypothetical protein
VETAGFDYCGLKDAAGGGGDSGVEDLGCDSEEVVAAAEI